MDKGDKIILYTMLLGIGLSNNDYMSILGVDILIITFLVGVIKTLFESKGAKEKSDDNKQ